MKLFTGTREQNRAMRKKKTNLLEVKGGESKRAKVKLRGGSY